MPKPTKGPRLGGGPAHERLMLANLAAALFTHKAITTTETKAKRVRPLAERLITFAKRGDLHARRRVLSVIGDKEVVHVLFTEIAPLVAEREGGYTRITKIGNRKGDNAPMARIELVLEPVNPKPKSAKKTPRRPLRLPLPSRRRRPRRPRCVEADETADDSRCRRDRRGREGLTLDQPLRDPRALWARGSRCVWGRRLLGRRPAHNSCNSRRPHRSAARNDARRPRPAARIAGVVRRGHGPPRNRGAQRILLRGPSGPRSPHFGARSSSRLRGADIVLGWNPSGCKRIHLSGSCRAASFSRSDTVRSALRGTFARERSSGSGVTTTS